MKTIKSSAIAYLLFVAIGSVVAIGKTPERTSVSTNTIVMDFRPSIATHGSSTAPVEKLRLTCPRVSGTAQVDGVLNDAIWSKAATAKPSLSSGPPATFQVGYDKDNLYVAVTAQQAAGTPTKAIATAPNEGRPWGDDCVEVFLRVEGETTPDYYQFVVNAAGSTFVLLNADPLQKIRPSANVRFPAAAKIEGERWTVEATIPREILGLKEWPSQMQFNIGRSGPVPFQPQAWGNQYGQGGMGTLVFQGVKPKEKVSPTIHKTHKPRQGQVESTGAGLSLSFDRTFAQPGERWIDGRLDLSPIAPLKQTKVRAELMPLSSDQVVSATELQPGLSEGCISVDLRAHDLKAGQLVVRLFENGKETGVARALLSVQSPSSPLEAEQKITLTLDVAPQTGAVKDWPVTICVPFAEGTLWNQNQVRIVNANRKEVPSQAEVLGRWGREGSIKWLRFDTKVSSGERYFVECLEGGRMSPTGDPYKGAPEEVARRRRPPTLEVKVTQAGDGVILDTGVARYVIAKGSSPIREIWLGENKVATSDGARGLYVIDQKGRLASADAKEETLKIEASGPQAACVRLEGYYRTKEGEPLARHITRIEVFAGQPLAKVSHTLVLCRDSNEVWFKDIGWEYSVASGGNAKAVFGIDREKPDASVAVELADSKSAWMIQDSHRLFRKGENHFSVGTSDSKAAIKEGKECGDWVFLTGSKAAMLMACRESARQHPKEFEVSADKINLKLFSNRAGEELDFRSPALVEKWNLKEWLPMTDGLNPRHHMENRRTLEQLLEIIRKMPSNAMSLAKSHDLIFSPLPPKDAIADAPKIGGQLTFPTYVFVDPKWIHQTYALGGLHPRDPERFPTAEAALDMIFKDWGHRDEQLALYGFVDFESGPFAWHPSAGSDGNWPAASRYHYHYNIKRDLLLMGARSADRTLWNCGAGINRALLDFRFAHWDNPAARRQKGGWVLPVGDAGDEPDSHGALPYLWTGTTEIDSAATSQPEDAIIYYYLTGNRRAKDVLDGYFQFLKDTWRPPQTVRDLNFYFPMNAMCAYTWGYFFTKDPDFIEITRRILDLIFDPEAPLRVKPLTPPQGASFKVEQEVHQLIVASQCMSDPRLLDLSTARTQFHLDYLQYPGIAYYQGAQGTVASYLYRQNQEPQVAQVTDLLLRQIGALTDPEWEYNNPPYVAGMTKSGRMVGILNGVIFGEDAVVRSEADRRPVASIVGASYWHNEREKKPGAVTGSIIIQKPANEPVTLRLSNEYYPPLPAGASTMALRYLDGPVLATGTDLNTAKLAIDLGAGTFELEKHGPAGSYELTGGGQTQFALANSRVPMVVYAPEKWTPFPYQYPYCRIYFKVPDGVKNGKITFEGTARLFDPSGNPFPDEKPVGGEISLPFDRPGLWSFQPVKNKKVRVTNLPPFFAFRDPAFYFEPKLAAPAK